MTKLKNKTQRIEKARELDKERILPMLFDRLRERRGIKLSPYNPDERKLLPQFTMWEEGAEDPRLLGFADVLFGKREDFIKVPVSSLRNGAFVTTHLQAPGTKEDPKAKDVRYLVFLADWDSFLFLEYSPKRKYVTLTMGDQIFACVPKTHFQDV